MKNCLSQDEMFEFDFGKGRVNRVKGIAKDAQIQKINVVSRKGFLRNSPVQLIKGILRS